MRRVREVALRNASLRTEGPPPNLPLVRERDKKKPIKRELAEPT